MEQEKRGRFRVIAVLISWLEAQPVPVIVVIGYMLWRFSMAGSDLHRVGWLLSPD